MSSDESGVAPSSSTTATSASAHAAMNVFHSFHAIGDEISSLQKERHTIEADKQAKADEMRRLRDEMAKMELAQRAAAKQHAEWTRKLEELQADPAEKSEPTPPAAPGGLSNRVKRGQLERLIGESREAFLQESVEFRRECARLRTQASSLGLADACTVAFLSAVHGIEIGNGEMEVCDGGGAPEQQHGEDTDDLDDDPAQWKHLDLDDAETMDLWNAYVASKERLVRVEQESAATSATLQQWKEKSATRKERVEHLESQLHRVTKENDDLEAKVKELHALAEQPRELEEQPNPTVEGARIEGTLDQFFRCTSFNERSHIFSSSSLST
jgi:chromosome segregation ATPase